MPGAVYSTRFLAGVSEGDEVVSYPVPAGKVAVVRFLTALADTDGGSLVQWFIDLGGGVLVYCAVMALPSGTVSDSLDCRLVLNPGETFNGQASGASGVVLTAHGYLLSLP